MTWRVATRRSVLARTQAALVADALAAATGRPAELVPLATSGDRHPDRAVEAFDAKGLFVDGVREAVLDGRAHLAVHSYKDLPTDPVEGLSVAAVPAREDPRDLLVTRDGQGLAGLPRGASVGTSSARRRAQLQRARRDLLVQPLRGNLDTRLQRVASGRLDAVVVALAGVRRLVAAGRLELTLAAVPLEPGECLHAPAQGALAVECRADDGETVAALRALDDAPTRVSVRAERALLRHLQGGCTAPIGAHAEVDADGRLSLLGMLADPTGTRVLRASDAGAADAPEELGRRLAARILEAGGADILARLPRDRRVAMGGP